MRAAVVGLACAAPAIAHAGDHCEVTYVTVPDGVKQVIEGWVDAEPDCRGSIALRVIPTKDGLFLFAERPDGTVHERLVPDLTAAGVLVASWVSDSWTDRPRKKKRAKRRDLEVRAVAVDELARVDAVAEPTPRGPVRKRWLSLGATRIPGSGGADLGFRLESDLILRGGWKLGVAAQKVQDTLRVDTGYAIAQGNINDWSAGLVVSHTLRWGGWELRGGAGVSILASKVQAEDFFGAGPDVAPIAGSDIDPSIAYELSATLARDVGERWGLALTFATTFMSQEWHTGNMDTITREQAQPVWVVSLRRRI